MYGRDSEVLAALQMPEGQSLAEYQVIPGNNRRATVQLRWRVALDADIVDDGTAIKCTGGHEIGERIETYTLDDSGYSIPFQVNLENEFNSVETSTAILDARMLEALDALDRKVSAAHAATMVANRGNYPAEFGQFYGTGAAEILDAGQR